MKATIHRTVYAVAVMFFAGYAVVSLAGPKGVAAWRYKERQFQFQARRNADLAREIDETRARIHKLETDPAEQERVVRDRLKLIRPGERVFVVPEERVSAGRK